MGNTLPRLNFNLQNADTEVGIGEQRMLLIGQMSSTGTATEKTLIKDIPNDNSWDILFGKKSMLASMVRQARKLCSLCQYQVKIDAIAIKVVSGTASTATITFDGTATANGTYTFVVGSEYNHKYTVDVLKDEDATAIATKLKDLINADLYAPFSANNEADVLTLTFEHKGTIGNDTTLYYEGTVAGVTVELTKFASGATDPAITDEILNLISNRRYQEIVSPTQYGIDKIIDLLDSRFNSNNRLLDGALYLDKSDTLSNHKSTVKPLNSQNVNYQCDNLLDLDNYKGSSIPEFDYIKAVYNATLKALRVSDGSQLSNVLIGQYPTDLIGGAYNNSLPFFNTSCPLLNPIDSSIHWNADEIKEINEVGGSVWDNNSEDNTLIMGEQLSTYKTDNAGNEDITWKFMNYRDTGSAIREFRFKNFKKDFAQSRMNSDTEKEIRNAFLRYYRTLSGDEYRLLRSDKESYKYYEQNLKVSLDYSTGTVTVICNDPYVTQLREVNGFFKATFNLTTGEVV